jgi:hypothetical protein
VLQLQIRQVTAFNVALEAQQNKLLSLFYLSNLISHKTENKLSALTAASILAGDSSFGLESIEIMLKTILSTCTS